MTPTSSDNEDNANYELYESGCWNTSLQLRIENELSVGYFGDEFQAAQEANSASYAGSDAGSWLLSLGQSLVLSMVLWQPMTVYLLTWICVWMFTWHIEILLPWSLPALIKRCCCGPESDDDDKDDDLSVEESQNRAKLTRQNSKRATADPKLLMLADSLRAASTRTLDLSAAGNSNSNRRGGLNLVGNASNVSNASSNGASAGNPNGLPRQLSRQMTRAQVVAHEDRPLDMMMFWGNAEFFIDDTQIEMEENTRSGKAAAVNAEFFRADSFRDIGMTLDIDGDGAGTTQQHVHNITASEDLEMQNVEVTWTKDQNGKEFDIVYENDENRKRGMAPVNSMSLNVPSGDGATGSIEEELANAFAAVDGGVRRKKAKKVVPIQHSSEWAY